MFVRRKAQRILTGIDIGTTKVFAITGRADDEGNLEILGVGTCPSRGLEQGQITAIQPTIEAISRAVGQAQDLARTPLGDVYVGIAGEHIRSSNQTARVEIRHPTRGIDEKDRRRVVQKAIDISLPEDEALIHSVVQEYRVNGGCCLPNPVGLSGSDLEVRTHVVRSNVDALNNIVRCVRGARLGNPQIVLQSLASSLSVVNRHELELGTLLIDIGGGTTDVAISRGGAIRATQEVALGGDRITDDIQQVLVCSRDDAENVKKRLGCAVPEWIERGRTFDLPVTGDFSRLKQHEEYILATIIETRLEDIFEKVRDFLDRSGFRGKLHAGAVLTGGTALLPGITDVAERMLEMKCRTGQPGGHKGFVDVVSSPIYSTGVGLLLYGLHSDEEELLPPRTGLRRWLDYLVETFI